VGLYQVCGKRCFCGHVLFLAHSHWRLVRSIGNRLDQESEAVSSFLVIMCITGRGVTCTCVALGQSSGYRGTKGATIPNTMIRLPFFQTSLLALSLRDYACVPKHVASQQTISSSMQCLPEGDVDTLRFLVRTATCSRERPALDPCAAGSMAFASRSARSSHLTSSTLHASLPSRYPQPRSSEATGQNPSNCIWMTSRYFL